MAGLPWLREWRLSPAPSVAANRTDVDRPRKATSGLGPLLATKRKGKKIVDFKAAAKAPTRSRRASDAKTR